MHLGLGSCLPSQCWSTGLKYVEQNPTVNNPPFFTMVAVDFPGKIIQNNSKLGSTVGRANILVFGASNENRQI